MYNYSNFIDVIILRVRILRFFTTMACSQLNKDGHNTIGLDLLE